MHDSVDIILTEVNMLSLDLFAQNRLSNIPCYSLHEKWWQSTNLLNSLKLGWNNHDASNLCQSIY